MRNKRSAMMFIVLVLSLMAPAYANEEVTRRPEASEDIVDGYHISCASETDSPTLLTAPDPKSLGREFIFDTTFSFLPDRFVEKDGIQYMEGRLINGAMRVMYKGLKGAEFPEATRDQWYALSSEWSCTLYRIIDGKRRL